MAVTLFPYLNPDIRQAENGLWCRGCQFAFNSRLSGKAPARRISQDLSRTKKASYRASFWSMLKAVLQLKKWLENEKKMGDYYVQ
jgi:hypothetical protein